jgi:hypothetical protein
MRFFSFFPLKNSSCRCVRCGGQMRFAHYYIRGETLEKEIFFRTMFKIFQNSSDIRRVNPRIRSGWE